MHQQTETPSYGTSALRQKTKTTSQIFLSPKTSKNEEKK